MGVIAKGILRGCQGLFTPVSLGYPLSVFNKNSTLKAPGCQLSSCGSVREEGEGTGIASDVIKVQGEDPATPGPLN